MLTGLNRLLPVLLLLYAPALVAQGYDGLVELNGSVITTWHSPGYEVRAKMIANRCEKAMAYVGDLVQFTPTVRIFVLAPEHWKQYAQHPLYGMPHYTDDRRLVVAAEDNDFWKSFIPAPEGLPAGLAAKVRQAYTTPEGGLSTMAFFDLLALHELGHGFHDQGGLTMHRLWMQELFCNILLHTYVAENEPEQLPALEVFPEMVVANGTAGFSFTSLADFEARYDDMDPRNYGWYQSRLHVAGKNIYDAGGRRAFIRLWKTLQQHHEPLKDEAFVRLLRRKAHRSVARVLTEW